jgi:hypothetical protein
MRYFDQLVARYNKSKRSAGRRRPSKRSGLTFESLETRQLLSASPVTQVTTTKQITAAQIAPATTTIQNMTQLAQQMISLGQLKAPTGPTYLYLNFDGYKANPDNGGMDITPFTGSAADVDSILYRTAEEFAPFNVIVQQMSGNAKFSTAAGATTIFIGNNLGGDFTPGAYMDYPHSAGSTSHVVNTDPYDIAYVSQSFPGLSTSIDRDASIANDVAHEAGHTFGLAHVRTDGQADFPTNPNNGHTYKTSNPPDVMSYDSNNDFFSNTTFNVTQANGTGVDPSLFPDYQGTDITLQNSFTYLQTVLGARPTTSQIGLADEDLKVLNAGIQTVNFVDHNYYTATPRDQAGVVSGISSVTGTLQTSGDYAAYKLSLVNLPSWTPGRELVIAPGANSMPVTLMVFDTGNPSSISPVTSGSLVAAGDFSKPIAFKPIAGETYTLVIGGSAGGTGAYSFTAAPLQLNLAGLSFAFTNQFGAATGTLLVNSQTDNAIKATYTPPGSTTGFAVNGLIGAAVNGLSPISFNYETNNVTSFGPPQEHTTIQVTTVVKFDGQASVTPTTYVMTGTGVYSITRTTTITNGTKGTRTTTTLVNLSLAKGTAARSSQTGSVGGTTTATKSAAAARASAADVVMANFSTTNSPTSDSNKRLTPSMLAFLL